MNVIIIRHTTVWNPHNICYGTIDIDLAESFEQEALAIKTYLASHHVEQVYSSPLGRCMKLAEYCFPHQKIEIDHRIKELNFGAWEGKTWQELEPESTIFYENFDVSHQFPQGESYHDLLQRIEDFAASTLFGNSLNTIAIFTHGGPMRAFISVIEKITAHESLQRKIEYGQILEYTI